MSKMKNYMMEIEYWPNRPCDAPKKYGIYHHNEGGVDYIKWVEENAPAMSEKLWKIREQFTIAEKIVFDAIITLPPMDKKEAVSKIAKYIGRSNGLVRDHYNWIMKTIDSYELKEIA